MLKVLLVDDEPFILQGLKVLINWKEEGFSIAGTASNGEEALAFLREQEVDLILADIKMPVMTGLELLEHIKEQKLSDAYVIILSGYADFDYAQQALRYDCMDYVLKPVEREELVSVIRKIFKINSNAQQEKQDSRKMKQAYLERNLIALIQGNYDNLNLEYVQSHMKLSEGVRYIEIKLDDMELLEEITDEDKKGLQRKLYQACLDFLQEDGSHCILDLSVHEKIYGVGLVYCEYMPEQKGVLEEHYLEEFRDYLGETVQEAIVMLVGKKVKGISNIARSYGTVSILRSFQGFRARKKIYYYEEEAQVTSGGIVLCKTSLDALLLAIEQNSQMDIRKSVELFYEEMQQMEVTGDTMTLNINYLLFQLIHLAIQQDDKVNQEEIMRVISESTFEKGVMRGSKLHLSRFACEYANYLAQLRKKVSHGVLAEIEKEIRENFAENLTLKEFSEKYYVNSAYLGQLFRKKYGQSFKDYLNSYRMEQAARMLLRTDDKIYQVAEKSGYHDLDYFVNRFIHAKGCTPAKFRRRAREADV